MAYLTIVQKVVRSFMKVKYVARGCFGKTEAESIPLVLDPGNAGGGIGEQEKLRKRFNRTLKPPRGGFFVTLASVISLAKYQ